ncbi:MAG: hypothetical protein JRN33_00010 [Nitrososphaerota archaeon]|jgi:hypothetical protein|nr:hypothetical protein [Nitrososphaerota archaeon]
MGNNRRFILKAAVSFAATSILSFIAYSLTIYAKTIGPVDELNPVTRYLMSVQGNTFYIQLLWFGVEYLAIGAFFWSDRSMAGWLFLLIPLITFPDPLHDALLVYGQVQFSPLENLGFLIVTLSSGLILSTVIAFPTFRAKMTIRPNPSSSLRHDRNRHQKERLSG